MHHPLGSCLLALLLSATSALAQFEGVLALKLTVVSKDGQDQGGGTLNLALAKAGMRGEIALQFGPRLDLHRVVLCRADTPNTNYLISDATKTYTEIDLSPPPEAESPTQAQAQWTVEKLGREKILGYKTQHVRATPKTGPGQPVELWLATDLLDFETYRKLQACSGGESAEGGLAQALKAAGAEGMPLKVLTSMATGDQVRLEAVKAEKKSLPASTFEIPPGYTKTGDGRAWTSR